MGGAVRVRRGVVVRITGAAALVAAVAALWLSPLRDELTLENARIWIAAASGPWWGPGAFILVVALLVPLIVPATVFVASASLIWGWAAGGTYALTGLVLGAFLSFLIGRWLGAGALRKLGRRGSQIADQLESAGFQSLLILRLVPIIPFAILNYAAGLAGLRGRDFFAATAIGAAPSVFIIAYSSDAIVRGTLSGQVVFQRILLAGVLLAVLAIVPMLLRRRAAQVAGVSRGK